MAKKADVYFECLPWQVVEKGFDPARKSVSESIFSLANEHMGVRGYFEEGGSTNGLLGSYLGGIYELDGEDSPGGYKGIVKQTHYMVCAPDYLYCPIVVDGAKLDLGACAFSGFERTLDLTNGLLSRHFIWELPGGKVSVTFERLLGMENPHEAVQRITLTAIDAHYAVNLVFGVNGEVIHRNTGRCDWQDRGGFISGLSAAHLYETKTTGQKALYGFALKLPVGASVTPMEKHLFSGLDVGCALEPNKPMVFEKRVWVDSLRQGEIYDDAPALLNKAVSGARASLDFDELLKSNEAHYAALWRTADVKIEGDPLNQQGIRYCIFQLHQTYRGFDGRNNIGAKGLTGEAYNGHAFWDTETYCLPYYLLNDVKAARNLLLYRYHTLPQARERAKQLDCMGACYPIATLNGKEACTLWQHASLQMQPSTSVAYAVWNYHHLTNDDAFLFREGIEMLVEISRYCTSRGNWNQDHTAYGYYGVMGPDEFHLMVNNNYYTNLMGKKTLDFTLQVLSRMESAAPEAYACLCGKLCLTDMERSDWSACAGAMLLRQDEKLVFEQHEGYFSLPHLDVSSIPAADFPLYHHWSYDRIYRTDMIKQPDVLMAMFLHPGDYTLAEKAANYDYYEPRCIHESSLSPSIHSIIASELKRHEEAFRFFGFAARLDLDNYNCNTFEGLHLANIAAAWVTIVFGFGGLRTDGDIPSLNPSILAAWQGYQFCLTLSGSTLNVKVCRETVTLSLAAGESVKLLVYGKEITAGQENVTLTLPEEYREH
jgi:maltose phosphorylase